MYGQNKTVVVNITISLTSLASGSREEEARAVTGVVVDGAVTASAVAAGRAVTVVDEELAEEARVAGRAHAQHLGILEFCI